MSILIMRVFFLIVLVVAGHVMELAAGKNISVLYNLIYLFHMPAFILITGYFTQKQSSPKIGGLLLQYFLFQTLYLLFDKYVLHNENMVFTFVVPYWILWFLVSTILWKIIVPLVAKYPELFILVGAVVLSVLSVGDVSVGRYLSISRTIVFFPFFLVGYYARKEHFEKLKKIPAWVALVLFIGSFFVVKKIKWLKASILYGASSYRDMELSIWEGIGYRLICLLWGFVLVCAFLSLVPDKEKIYSTWGQRTLPVFLLHGFVLKYVAYKMEKPFVLDDAIDWVLLCVVIVGLTGVLLLKPLEKLASPVLYPLRTVKKIYNKWV